MLIISIVVAWFNMYNRLYILCRCASLNGSVSIIVFLAPTDYKLEKIGDLSYFQQQDTVVSSMKL